MDYIHLLIVRKTCFMATIFVNVCVFFLGGGGSVRENIGQINWLGAVHLRVLRQSTAI